MLFFNSQSILEAYKQSSPDDSECKIKFQKAFAKILDDVQSVIDSPHTRKEKRERILALCENAQDIMKEILEKHKDNKVIAGLPQSGKSQGKTKFFQGQEKSRNSVSSQGNAKFHLKVSEKAENFIFGLPPGL